MKVLIVKSEGFAQQREPLLKMHEVIAIIFIIIIAMR